MDSIDKMVIQAAVRIVARGEVATAPRIYRELQRRIPDKSIRKIRRSLVFRGLLDTGSSHLKKIGGHVGSAGPRLPDIEDRIARHTERVSRELRERQAAGTDKPTNRGNSKRGITP